MAYQRQTFINEETVLHAEMLEHIEDGIVNNENSIRNKADLDSNGKVKKEQLPNAAIKPLTINGTEYDGSEAVSVVTREFVFNVTGNSEDGYTSDASFEAVGMAYATGRTVICMFNGEMFTDVLCPLTIIESGGGLGFVCSPMNGISVAVVLTPDGVDVMEYVADLTIGEQTWDMLSPVDFTDTINNMIDEKSNLKPSVKSYGAVGDGTTDDTVAFQTALAENRLVYVPEGTYKLSDTLIVKPNCEFELSQATHLKFTQTSGNCIELRSSATLRGNHAVIEVPYAFTGNVISADTQYDEGTRDTPPFAHYDPMWKRARYIYDVCIVKPNSAGLHCSIDGKCSGTGIYLSAKGKHLTDGDINFIWGAMLQGIRIAGGFTYGIQVENIDNPNDSMENDAWNHDMRIEAVIQGCETGVSLFNCNLAHLSVTIQPSTADGSDAYRYTKYAKWGVRLEDCKGIDMTSSFVWDWGVNNTLISENEEYTHIAMYGNCTGLVLGDYLYHANSTDIRKQIYTDRQSNLEKMTILQEPITRWFKPINNEPYFTDGYNEKRLLLKEEFDNCFITDNVPAFEDVLSTATGTDGKIYNDIGYKLGVRFASLGTGVETDSAYHGLTGFIPCKKGSKIYAEELSFNVGDTYCGMVWYDADKNRIGSANRGHIVANDQSSFYNSELTDKGFIITIANTASMTNVAYVRFCIYKTGIGTKPVIAVDEEIKYTQEGFLNDNIKLKAENVIGLPSKSGVTLESPNGTLFKIAVNDDGTLTTIVQ